MFRLLRQPFTFSIRKQFILHNALGVEYSDKFEAVRNLEILDET